MWTARRGVPTTGSEWTAATTSRFLREELAQALMASANKSIRRCYRNSTVCFRLRTKAAPWAQAASKYVLPPSAKQDSQRSSRAMSAHLRHLQNSTTARTRQTSTKATRSCWKMRSRKQTFSRSSKTKPRKICAFALSSKSTKTTTTRILWCLPWRLSTTRQVKQSWKRVGNRRW